MKTKKKRTTKKSVTKKSAPKPNQEMFEINRIWYGIGFALIALALVSNLPYTQRFDARVLGDKNETEAEDQEKHNENEPEDAEDHDDKEDENTNEYEFETAAGVKVKTKTEDNGSKKTEIEAEKFHFRYDEEQGKVKLRAENELGEEVQTREKLRERDELEKHLEDEDIEVSTEDGKLRIEHNAVRARTHFPLSIDPVTHELIVTTPAGEKRVTVLPDTALKNLLFSGLLSEVATGSGTTEDATESATLADSVELEMEGDALVYTVSGQKYHRLFGLFPVTTHKTVKVSAETGEILSQTQSWLAGIVDFLSR